MFPREHLFTDRREAGRQLALALGDLASERPVVLALPRGGVPVAYEVARALKAPLDLVMVRKIGAPGHAELGIGAVVDGDDPQIVINTELAAQVGATDAYIRAQAERELQEIERRRACYTRGREPVPLKDRTAIVVDDGIATGGTARAVLQALSRTGARRVVLAVPVAPPQAVEQLVEAADEVACLATPDPFYAVGLHYTDFAQTTDDEVVELLDRAREELEGAPSAPGPGSGETRAPPH
jgi:putative phosphoribosyl transferase